MARLNNKDTIRPSHTTRFMLRHGGINTNAPSLLLPSHHPRHACRLSITFPLREPSSIKLPHLQWSPPRLAK